MSDVYTVDGTILNLIFQNEENGYTVLRLVTTDGEVVTVVGTIPCAAPGESLVVTGQWMTHPVHGEQLQAQQVERYMPTTENDILSYLSSGVIKGVGPATAEKLVQRFGTGTLRILEEEPELLTKIKGITARKAMEIGESYRAQTGMRRLLDFLAVNDLPLYLGLRLYRRYGVGAMDAVRENPYLLVDELYGVDFAVMDEIALSMGVAGDSRRRVEAAVLFELTYNLNNGHVFLPRGKLIAAAVQLIDCPADTAEIALDDLIGRGAIRQEPVAKVTACYLSRLHGAETGVTERLERMLRFRSDRCSRVDRIIDQIQKEQGIVYAAAQRRAGELAAQEGVLLLTGGPGTGKTTILRGILELLGQNQLRCLLAAPTGRAAKRLTEVTGEDASTIHRLLEAGIDPATGKMFFARDAENPLKCDAVIVDEMSMVDVSLLYSLLQAIPTGKRLILVGDPDQLPPVGPGFPFGDMLRSGSLPTVRLTEIFRQAQKSLIVMNAHRVNQGEMPDLKCVSSDFFFMRRTSEEAVCALIRDLCATRLPQKMGIPTDQIQVLSPTRKGAVGTVNLNRLLQAALNPQSPDKKERSYGDYQFREGDRVMQIRNNYDILWKKADGSAVGAGIFNGDVGRIQTIDPASETLTVLFDDRVAEYDFTQLGELEPAYAMTVHKSQGSEYRAVILTAWNGSPYLLSRSILYTAITRARELLIIVGREETVGVMVENARKNRRYSGLKLRLQGKVE